MKAIIVDRDDRFLIVLNKKGDFIKINNRMPHCRIGDEIEIPDRMPLFALSRGLPLLLAPARKIAATLVVLLVLLGMGGYAIADYLTPVTFVTMDLHPGVELALNRYQRVLSVNTFDDEGNLLVKDSGSFRNMKLENAVKELLDRAEAQNFLKPSSTLVFTVSSRHDQVPEELDSKLRKTVEARKDIQVIVEKTPIEKREEARKANASQGKFRIYEKVKKVIPKINLEEVRKSSLSRIMEQLDKSVKGKEKPSKEKKDDKKTDTRNIRAPEEAPVSNSKGIAEKKAGRLEKTLFPQILNRNNMPEKPEKEYKGGRPSADVIKLDVTNGGRKNLNMRDATEKTEEVAERTGKEKKNGLWKGQKGEKQGERK